MLHRYTKQLSADLTEHDTILSKQLIQSSLPSWKAQLGMLIQTAVAVAGRSFIRQMDSLDESQLFRSSWKCPGKLSHGSLARIPIILYGSHNITYKQIMTKSDALCYREWLIYNNGIHLWFLYTFRLWFVLVAVRRMSNSTASRIVRWN